MKTTFFEGSSRIGWMDGWMDGMDGMDGWMEHGWTECIKTGWKAPTKKSRNDDAGHPEDSHDAVKRRQNNSEALSCQWMWMDEWMNG